MQFRIILMTIFSLDLLDKLMIYGLNSIMRPPRGLQCENLSNKAIRIRDAAREELSTLYSLLGATRWRRYAEPYGVERTRSMPGGYL